MIIRNCRNSTIQIGTITVAPLGQVEIADDEWKRVYSTNKLARDLLAGGFIGVENKQNKKKEKK